MIDPVSIALVTAAALGSAGVKKLITTLWEDVLLPRLKNRHEVTITSPSGQQIRLDNSEPMTEERIKEIVAKLG
jgi:hypothetical protein